MKFDIQPQASEGIEIPQDAIDHVTMEKLAAEMRACKDKYEEIELKVKDLKKEYEGLQEQLFDKMLEQGLPKITFDFGSFTRDYKHKCSINPDRQDQAFSMLEEQGLGASIKRAINWQTLNKHFREGELEITENSAVFKTWRVKTIAMRRKN